MFKFLFSFAKSFANIPSSMAWGITVFCYLALSTQSIKADMIQQKAPALSADVSYIIVDLKFNAERGAQICEIQHGFASAFKGDAMFNNGQSVIAQKLHTELSRFYEQSWASYFSFSDPTTRKLFYEDPCWIAASCFNELITIKQFQINAALPVKDPTDLSSYHGFVFISLASINDRDSFLREYPGVLLIDNAFYNYANNKFRMTQVMMGHPLMEKHKPKWRLYNRKDSALAERINSEIGSDMLVMKPLDKYRGEGVIIIRKEELKSILEYLFDKTNSNFSTEDPAYKYWRNTKSTKFIIEEFIESDPVSAPHLDGKLYSPTMRLAFLLSYNKNTIKIVCLGGYDKLPMKAISEPGSLNQKYKTCSKMPYYAKADPEIMEQAEAQIKEVLYILYQKLLGLN